MVEVLSVLLAVSLLLVEDITYWDCEYTYQWLHEAFEDIIIDRALKFRAIE